MRMYNCMYVSMHDFMYVCKYECVRTYLLCVYMYDVYYLFVTNKEVGCISDRKC